MHKQDFTAHFINLDEGRYALKNRLWQGVPSLECTRGGRLWAAWYSGGAMEPAMENFAIIACSDDGGLTWDELFGMEGNPDKRQHVLDPQFWTDPNGKFWLFWVQRNWFLPRSNPEHTNTWAMTCDNPDDDSPVFSEPFFVCDGFLRNRPTVLKDGRWFLPAYEFSNDHYAYVESCDQGKSFVQKFAGKKIETDFDESMILERCDGSLLLMARAEMRFGFIAKCESFDGGKTWTDGELSDIRSPRTRFFLRRLPSGRVMLINNDNTGVRDRLLISLSEDDGKTWKYNLMLDERYDVSYPDMTVAPDGSFYIIHDREREIAKEVLVSHITEDDIIAGRVKDPGSFQNNLISKAPAVAADGLWSKKALLDYDLAFIHKYLEEENSGKAIGGKEYDTSSAN